MSTGAIKRDASVVIRPLEAPDIDRLPVEDDTRAYMKRIVERSDWTHKGIRAFVTVLSEDDTASNQEQQLVGYAFAGLGYPPYFPALPDDVRQLYLAGINVFEPFQRRGYATQMLEFFKEEAERLELHVIRNECEKGWRVGLYERVGFQCVPYKGPRDDYPVDAHQMLELWLQPVAATSE